MADLIVTASTGGEHVLGGSGTDTVMERAREAGLPVRGECGGSMYCGTCHVIVDPAWAGRLTAPGDEEADLLDALFDRQQTSRLGCQITMADELDGLRVRLPETLA
ncbi:2Fe-2S iron-sulfur cluster-binding protein [Amycolatopsis sp. Hca4]|uniref:2Fe-2S iron-sulfur cluster-binding protein n=1 Tax=Amycolatopsis sp. Hca4 TaxID=2742131 RepID=UPI0015916852|nr:2Fe-2S iron-sulfur cluster-binding protein [Amycolatopsis sp. Hca4]QKV74062.1 2Fe-2S iron-sulfur cluster binding domain-containing protein [Amycolatopsis sp. Hca4]